MRFVSIDDKIIPVIVPSTSGALVSFMTENAKPATVQVVKAAIAATRPTLFVFAGTSLILSISKRSLLGISLVIFLALKLMNEEIQRVESSPMRMQATLWPWRQGMSVFFSAILVSLSLRSFNQISVSVSTVEEMLMSRMFPLTPDRFVVDIAPPPPWPVTLVVLCLLTDITSPSRNEK